MTTALESSHDTERYTILPTPHVPNSKLPIIVYRKVLLGYSEDAKVDFLESNGWKKGGKWGPYAIPHFHSTVHECYAVIRGKGTYVLGKSPIDDDINEAGQKNGLLIDMEEGDVVVLPSGVAHALINPKDDWEVAGFYPEGSPPWDMNYCKDSVEDTSLKAVECEKVPIPEQDPVFGTVGPLPRVWREARIG